MIKLMRITGAVIITAMITVGCDSVVNNHSEEEFSDNLSNNIELLEANHCEETGVDGLTANYVNEIPSGPFDVTCDIGIYFDEDATVNRVALNGTVAGAKSQQHGIYIDGAEVDVSNLTVIVDDDYPHQFVSVAYFDGATGNISKSELTGAHRVGLLVRGEGTDITARGNKIIGTGANTTGWAENGIQVDQGAIINFTNNDVAGHWWDGESNFASTGLLLFGSNSSVTNNNFTDNEFSAYVFGNDNSFKSNKVSSDVVSVSSFNFMAYGALVYGSDNDLTGNRLTATEGAVGIFILPDSEGNKLTGNRISGFQWAIYDGGDDTMERGNPSVFN